MRRSPLALFALLCLHCGSTTPPSAEPASLPGESTAPAADNSGPPVAEPAPTEAPAAESAAPAASAAPAKKPCPELPKSTCKVTNGCAWSDQKKCVAEGP